MRARALGSILFVASATAATPASATDYAAPGPMSFATSDLPAAAGGTQGGKLVVPSGAGSYPILVTSHGFSAAADNQLGWAEHFASYGFVVVVPTFTSPLSPDAQKDADAIRALVAMYGDPSFASPAQGKVDASRVGLEGHSAGGLATTLAAAALKPRATVLFDPVDKNDLGKAAYATLCGPVLGIFADASSCNNTAAWSAFKTASVGPQILFNVVGSTHCDGENHPRALCGPFCGGAADPGRQAGYGRYATAFFLANLKGDAQAAAALAEPVLKADALLANVIVRAAPSCSSPTPDAGVPQDSGAPDASAVVADADAPRDASASPGVDASAVDASRGESSGAPSQTAVNSGCACGVGGSARHGALGAIAFGALALVGSRRRRRQPRG